MAINERRGDKIGKRKQREKNESIRDLGPDGRTGVKKGGGGRKREKEGGRKREEGEGRA